MRLKVSVIAEIMRRSWQIAPWASAAILLLSILQFAGPPVVAALQRAAIDSSRGETTASIVMLAVGLAAAACIVSTAAFTQACIRDVLSEKMNWGLSGDVIKWVAGVPEVDLYDRPDQLNELHQVRANTRPLAGLAWNSVLTIGTVVMLGISLAMLAEVSPWFILMSILAVPPLLLNNSGRRKVLVARDRVAPLERVEERLNSMVNTPEEAKEIRISRSFSMINGRCVDIWSNVRQVLLKANLVRTAYTAAGWAIFAAAYAAAMVLGVHLVMRGQASLGDLALVVTLGESMRRQVSATVFNFGTVHDVGHIAAHFSRLRARWMERAGQAPGHRDGVPRNAGIRLHGVTFTYPGARETTVRDLSIELPAGSLIAVIGENGAGKTTLVKLILGHYTPQEGRVQIGDADLREINNAQWSSVSTGLLQDFAMLQGPIRESVGAPEATSPGHMQRVKRALRDAKADVLVERLPGGLDTELGVAFDGPEVSYGQWQRLALARGMVRVLPQLLVLDEPTSALDPQVEHDLYASFMKRARVAARKIGGIAIIVSHRLATVRDVDMIVVMEDGQVVEMGTHSDLVGVKDGRYAEMYRMQVEAFFE